jgi:hypothetical protein
VEECFFFHSFMNQDPGEDLLDLPQEPQVLEVLLSLLETTDTVTLLSALFLLALTFPFFHFMHLIRSVHVTNLAAQSDRCKKGKNHLNSKYENGNAVDVTSLISNDQIPRPCMLPTPSLRSVTKALLARPLLSRI